MGEYTPDGVRKQPGYDDPYNPYATGRAGENNSEKNGGRNNTESGWDYDNGRPFPGAVQLANGEWVLDGGGGGGGGGGDPQALFSAALNSPWYQQALAAVNAAAAADAASRRSAIQQALIQFGLVPQGFADKYGDVTDTTRSLAEQNTSSGISAYARLQQALKDAQRNSRRNLAARGLFRSGDRGFQMRKNQLSYDRNYSDAVNQLLGGINQTYGNFAQNEYQRQMSLAGALQNAIGNMGSFYRGGYGGGGGGVAAPAAPAPADPYQAFVAKIGAGQPSTPRDFLNL